MASTTRVVVVAWTHWGAPLDGALRAMAVSFAESIAPTCINTTTPAGQPPSEPDHRGHTTAVPSSVVVQRDVADLTLHRTIKHVANVVRSGCAVPAVAGRCNDPVPSSLVVVLLPVFAAEETRRSLFHALSAIRRDEGVPIVLVQLVLTAPAVVGSAEACTPAPSLFVPWLEGHEVATALFCKGTRTHAGGYPPRMAASAPASIADGADVTMSSSQWLMSQSQLLQALPYLPVAGHSVVGGRQCMFLGVCEVATVVSSVSTSDTGAAMGPTLALDPRVRRWVCEWCCQPNRIVCFVQAGGAASGERYPMGIVQQWLTSLGTNTTAPLPVPVAYFLSYIAMDDATEVGTGIAGGAARHNSSNGSHLAAAPVPLTLSGLSCVATALHVSISESLAIASAATGLPWASAVPSLPVLDVADEASVLRRMRDLRSSVAAPESQWEDPLPPRWAHPHHTTVSFGHRLRADMQYWAPPPAPPPTDGGPLYACSVEVLQEGSGLCDTKTAQIARRYVHDHYLLNDTVSIARYGTWSVLASARCCSSDRSLQYDVDVGTVRGRVVHARCTCASASLTKLLCRHAAALCVTLLGVQLESLVDVYQQVDVAVTERVTADVASSADAELRDAILEVECRDIGDSHRVGPASTYCPQPTEMTASGLPSYMTKPVKLSKSSRRGDTALTPPHSRRSGASVSMQTVDGPNAPKGKRMTPFFYFSMQQRPALRIAQPALRPTEVARQLGLMWRALSDEARDAVAVACRADGDAWDAEWAAYHQTEEYKEALAAAQQRIDDSAIGDANHRPTQRRRIEDVGVVDATALDANDTGAAVPTEDRFHALNPEWQRDADGNWRCAWDDDASSELLDAGDMRIAHVPPQPKLGSLAVGCFPEDRRGTGSGARVGSALSRRGTSEMETRASLLRSDFLDH